MLSNATALVTGASSGIGRATAQALAEAGAAVIVHGRREEATTEITDQLRQTGANVRMLLADLADPEQRLSLIQQAWDWRGEVDVWINNAGVDVLTGEAAEWPFERKLEALWQVDVQGTIALSRAVGARMQARPQPRRDASIINMGWDQAAGGMEGDSGEMFAAAKGAVMAFTRSLAKTLAPTVRVNCVAPGWIQTKWGQQASDAWRWRAANESLLKRWGQPEDVARTIVFLASPAGAFINGQVLAVNGGFSG